jgi:very-short-patch-repair endonuclease
MKRRIGLRRTGFTRRPRPRMSAAEDALWTRLGSAPFDGTFRPRMPVGRLTADIGSYDAMLVIEIDHAGRGDAHARATAFESAGYHVLRFAEDEILADIDRVMEQIAQAIEVWSG